MDVAAPSREAQASDALLALAKMQPLSASGAKYVTEQEMEDLKHQASSEKWLYFQIVIGVRSTTFVTIVLHLLQIKIIQTTSI